MKTGSPEDKVLSDFQIWLGDSTWTPEELAAEIPHWAKYYLNSDDHAPLSYDEIVKVLRKFDPTKRTTMKPSQVAKILRHIASSIQNSKNPNKNLVVKDLGKILTAMKDVDELEFEATLDQIKFLNSNIREYVPVGPESPYPTIDGSFEFQLPDGRVCKFDGRLDPNDQTGTLICDGKDVSNELWSEGGDSARLDFLGLDADLDEVLEIAADNTIN